MGWLCCRFSLRGCATRELFLDRILDVSLGPATPIRLFYGRKEPTYFLPRVNSKRITPHDNLDFELYLALVLGKPVGLNNSLLFVNLNRPLALEWASVPILFQTEPRCPQHTSIGRREIT